MNTPNTIALIIDTQYDFVMSDGLLPVPAAENIIPGLNRFIANLDADQYAAAVFTFDTHEPEAFAASEEGEMFNLHCEKGTPGWENILNLGMVPKNIPAYTLEKGVFDMWAESDLQVKSFEDPNHPATVHRILMSRNRDTYFAELKDAGITTIAIVGVAADFCVKDAIKGALERGFNVEVDLNLTAGIERGIEQVIAEEFNGNVAVVDMLAKGDSE